MSNLQQNQMQFLAICYLQYPTYPMYDKAPKLRKHNIQINYSKYIINTKFVNKIC